MLLMSNIEILVSLFFMNLLLMYISGTPPDGCFYALMLTTCRFLLDYYAHYWINHQAGERQLYLFLEIYCTFSYWGVCNMQWKKMF